MNTGILPDGSLTPRLKGDLYWKKQKQMFRTIGFDKKRVNAALMQDLLVRYDNAVQEGIVEPITGDEFTIWPPTAVGTDISLQNKVRAMIYRNTLKKEENHEILPLLEDALVKYFEMKGFSEAERKPVEISDVQRLWIAADYDKAIKAYKQFLDSKSGDTAGACAEENDPETFEFSGEYSEEIIPISHLSEYLEHIPENYVGQIKDGSLKATAYYVKTGGGEPSLCGLSVIGVHMKWVELVWLVPAGEYKNDSDKVSDLLRYIISVHRDEKCYKGLFSEIHKGIEKDTVLEALLKSGMWVFDEKNNNYEFRYKDIKRDKSLLSASEKIACKPLSLLTDDEKAKIEDVLYDSDQLIPVALPIPWNRFRQDLSFAYSGQLGTGLLLISEIGDTLDVELLYGSNPVITASLLGTALTGTEGQVSPEQKILVPIVVESSRQLIKRLVDGATRGDITEALVWFDMPDPGAH